ncbi:MAG: serine/threonine protein kinase [Polyangiaceae bacterium]|nr:serine/threonine protein kinase [Polyangiaceae bacterium]
MFVCSECGRSYPAPGFCTEDGGGLQATAGDELLGTIVGSYRIAAKLGEGGMGVVYKGVHPNIGSRVAIKLLSPECAKSPALVERFFAEARAVNVIRHDNIVSVSDLASLPDGRPYIVMEYLDGAPLSGILKRVGALPLGTLVDLATELLDALGAAHDKGVIHRDLKPDNVFITGSGRVKVLDFGIAKLRPELGGISDATRTGSLLGTPHYMSPEQAAGRPVDIRSDLYSAGVILFEAATGQRPFSVDSLYELLKAHVELMPTAPRLLRPEIPPVFEQVLLRALQKDPAYRFQSARELAQALSQVRQILPADAFVPVSTLATLPAGSNPRAARVPTPIAVTPATLARGPSPELSPPLTPPPVVEKKRGGRFGYFVVGTCGVITLATLGSCVTCVFIGANADGDAISVPVGNGEVAVFKPKAFDVTGFTARAMSIASHRDESAKLVSIDAKGSWSNKTVNLADEAGDRVVYAFRTSSGCVNVDVGPTGLTTQKAQSCPERTVSPPRCSTDVVFDKAEKTGGPSGYGRATLTFAASLDGSGSWRIKNADWDGSVPDDC